MRVARAVLMNLFGKTLAKALLVCAGCVAMAQTPTPQEGGDDKASGNIPGYRTALVLHDSTSTTGSFLRRDVKWSSRIPLDKTYEQLSPREMAELRALYVDMPSSDEPPFPLQGMRPIFNSIRKGQQIAQAKGRLDMVVTVDAEGKAKEVANYGGVEGSNADRMIQYAGSVLLMTRFKPAVCSGKPCQSQFPLVIDLRSR